MASVAISIGIAAGSMVLQYLFTPKIKQEPTDRGKLDDIRIQGSEYGAFIPRTWGRTRIAGNIVVSTGIDHYQSQTTTRGSKKQPGGTVIDHIYKTSLAIVICRNQIANFLRIWADANLLTNNNLVYANFFEAESAGLSGGASTFSDVTASGGSAVENIGNGGKITFNLSSLGDPPLPLNQDPDEFVTATTRVVFYYKTAADRTVTLDTNLSPPFTESFLASPTEWTAKTVIITGFASSLTYENASAAAPNLDKIFVEKFWERGVLDPLRPSYSISGVINPEIGYPPDPNDPSEYYNYLPENTKDGATGTYAIETSVAGEQIRFYTGTETQTADAKIKSWLDGRYGAGQGILRASPMRGLAYVMLQDRVLSGNRAENFTFETDTGDNTVNGILEDLFADVGLVSADYDITATDDLTQVGFLENTNASRKTLIEYLERYHLFRIGEYDGKIYTIPDSFASIATLNANDLRAHNYGEERPAFDAEVLVKEENLLPREVRVSIMHPDLEYHNESVTAQVFASISGKESKEYTFPIVDPASQARNRAERLLLKEHSEDKAIEFWGMPATAIWAIGDVVTVPIGGVEQKLRIEKKQPILPIGKIRFQGVSVNPFIPAYYQDAVTEFAQKAVEQFARDTFPRNTVIFPIQSQPIRDADKSKLGVYLAISGRGRGNGDRSSLYRETAEDNFVLEQKVEQSSPLGLCEDTLGNHTAGVLIEDTTNVLDIWFFDDISIETVTQNDIDRSPHINLIRVGDEWLQYRTATAQTLEDNSPYRSKWRISNLWRGKFGTSGEIAGHVANEYAAVATPALIFYELESADIGETITLKATTAGQSVELAPITSFIFTPVSAYSVTNGTENRTLDANNTTVNILADFVATLADDLNL